MRIINNLAVKVLIYWSRGTSDEGRIYTVYTTIREYNLPHVPVGFPAHLVRSLRHAVCSVTWDENIHVRSFRFLVSWLILGSLFKGSICVKPHGGTCTLVLSIFGD